jgi:hypothetical protein
VVIGSNNTTLKINNEVVALLSEEMRWKSIEGSTPEAFSMRGRSVSRKKGKPFSGRSRSRSRSMSLVQSTRRCWTCGKPGHDKKDYKLKGADTSKDLVVTQSTEGKSTEEEKGDVYLDSISTQTK